MKAWNCCFCAGEVRGCDPPATYRSHCKGCFRLESLILSDISDASARPVKDYCQQYNVRLVPRLLLKVLHWQGKGRQLEVRAQYAPWLLWEDRFVTLLMMSIVSMLESASNVCSVFTESWWVCNRTPMSFSVFSRQQQACRPKNKPKYIWCFAKARGIKHRNSGWPANMFNVSSSFVETSLKTSPIKGPSPRIQTLYLRTLVFITSYLQ